jgi:hypothetical protein
MHPHPAWTLEWQEPGPWSLDPGVAGLQHPPSPRHRHPEDCVEFSQLHSSRIFPPPLAGRVVADGDGGSGLGSDEEAATSSSDDKVAAVVMHREKAQRAPKAALSTEDKGMYV